MSTLFPYLHGACHDDFGNLVFLSNEAWDNAWCFFYGAGYYECQFWPVHMENGHV